MLTTPCALAALAIVCQDRHNSGELQCGGGLHSSVWLTRALGDDNWLVVNPFAWANSPPGRDAQLD